MNLVAVLMRSLSLIALGPEWEGKGQHVSVALGLAATLIERGEEGMSQLAELTAMVEQMAKEQRPPSVSEWAALRARSDAAHAQLQAAL